MRDERLPFVTDLGYRRHFPLLRGGRGCVMPLQLHTCCPERVQGTRCRVQESIGMMNSFSTLHASFLIVNCPLSIVNCPLSIVHSPNTPPTPSQEGNVTSTSLPCHEWRAQYSGKPVYVIYFAYLNSSI
jgi:hypothetical protein